MKVEIDFIGATATLTFAQLKELIDEASTKGYEAGVKDQKAKDRLKKHENENVSRPTIKRVPPKPPACVTPKNNKAMLEKFLGGKLIEEEEGMIHALQYGSGYQDGFRVGYDMGEKGEKPEFDPKLHVDNSLYGWASVEEMKKLNTPKGHITVLRNKNDWAKDVETTFVKITPAEKK